MKRIDKNMNWTMKIMGEETYYPAAVPGSVYTDLINAGRLESVRQFLGFFFINNGADLRSEFFDLSEQRINITAAGKRFDRKVRRSFSSYFKGLFANRTR